MFRFLKVPDESDPASRTHRNLAMMTWFLGAAAVSVIIGIACWRWTAAPLALIPVFVLAALVYLIMAITSHRQEHR